MAKLIETVKNRRSGSEFIVVEYTAKGKVLLLTPEGNIFSLSLDLFYDPTIQSEEDLLRDGRLNQAQLSEYDQFNKIKEGSIVDDWLEGFYELSLDDQRRVLEKIKKDYGARS